MWRLFTSSALCLIFLLAGCDRGSHPEHVGTPAPAFSVTDGTRTVTLASYRGKVVLVNFWATWCTPCIEEIPSLEALQKQMPQIVILAISIDEDAEAYHRFLVDHQVTLLTVNDPDQRVNKLYGTHLFPETYVVDQSGYLRRKFVIAQDWTSPEIINYLKHI